MARRLLLAAAIALPAALVALVAAARQAPVLERGRLLGWFEQYDAIARVRLAGVELYVDTSSGVADLLTVTALALVAALFAAGAAAARRDPALRRTFTTAALGALYLGADDLLGVHETVGHNVGVLAGLPLVDHPDDVVMALYGVLAAAFAWRHRRLLGGPARRWWLVAGAAGALAIGHDVLPLHAGAFEEVLEVVAGGALLVASGLAVRQSLGGARMPGAGAYAAISTGYRRRMA